ncbi:MAG: hypothetical protein J3K34DRAFT_442334 [Monoraphidium minutum]|nr:MAG: hypothetical protein J3K34DRAFT_442334 [Monoraphidium minutum]
MYRRTPRAPGQAAAPHRLLPPPPAPQLSARPAPIIPCPPLGACRAAFDMNPAPARREALPCCPRFAPLPQPPPLFSRPGTAGPLVCPPPACVALVACSDRLRPSHTRLMPCWCSSRVAHPFSTRADRYRSAPGPRVKRAPRAAVTLFIGSSHVALPVCISSRDYQNTISSPMLHTSHSFRGPASRAYRRPCSPVRCSVTTQTRPVSCNAGTLSAMLALLPWRHQNCKHTL